MNIALFDKEPRYLVAVLICATIVSTAAPISNVAAGDPPAPLMTNLSPSSLDGQVSLSSGDVVSFRILEDTNDPIHLTVTDSGELEIPCLGRVKATAKTCKQLAEEIKVGLEKDFYNHATVVLAIDSLHNKKAGRAYVTGQIRTPGPLDLLDDEKLMVSEAILEAGGFSEFADRHRVKVMRQTDTPGVVKTFYVDVLSVWEKGRKERDLEVKPGDQIFVASKLVNF